MNTLLYMTLCIFKKISHLKYMYLGMTWYFCPQLFKTCRQVLLPATLAGCGLAWLAVALHAPGWLHISASLELSTCGRASSAPASAPWATPRPPCSVPASASPGSRSTMSHTPHPGAAGNPPRPAPPSAAAARPARSVVATARAAYVHVRWLSVHG
jgi:hypothetical protein